MRSLSKTRPCRTLAVFLTQPNLSFYLLFDYAHGLSLGVVVVLVTYAWNHKAGRTSVAGEGSLFMVQSLID